MTSQENGGRPAKLAPLSLPETFTHPRTTTLLNHLHPQHTPAVTLASQLVGWKNIASY